MQPPTTQNTGSIPSMVDSAPEASGMKVWLALSRKVRIPSTSPWRPAGEVLNSSAMIIGCAQPRPRPRTKDRIVSGAALLSSGKSR